MSEQDIDAAWNDILAAAPSLDDEALASRIFDFWLNHDPGDEIDGISMIDWLWAEARSEGNELVREALVLVCRSYDILVSACLRTSATAEPERLLAHISHYEKVHKPKPRRGRPPGSKKIDPNLKVKYRDSKGLSEWALAKQHAGVGARYSEIDKIRKQIAVLRKEAVAYK